MLWVEDPVTGDRKCVCPPLCDNCPKVRKCLDAGVPIKPLTKRQRLYGDSNESYDRRG